MQAYEIYPSLHAEKPVTAYYEIMVMDCTNPLNAQDPFDSSFGSYHCLIYYFLHLRGDFPPAHYRVHRDAHDHPPRLSHD